MKDDQGAVIRTEMDFDDVDIQFDFRFSGGRSFNLVIDDKNGNPVHSEHVCRVSVFQDSPSIGDDKTDNMNLEVRKQRQDNNLPAVEAEAIRNLLERTQASEPIAINPGAWHTLRVRIRGWVLRLDAAIFGMPRALRAMRRVLRLASVYCGCHCSVSSDEWCVDDIFGQSSFGRVASMESLLSSTMKIELAPSVICRCSQF